MILSPAQLMKAHVETLMLCGCALNAACWVAIGLLLNFEFLSSFMRYQTAFDIFIS